MFGVDLSRAVEHAGSMRRSLKIIFAFLAILACVPLPDACATVTERRLALVIGNASYQTKPLATAINDAGLIAQTLQSAGFEVIGARDLGQDLLRKAINDLTDKVARTGPGATVVVYFSGYTMQTAGENYLIPIGAEISDVADLPARALSLTELMQALATLKASSIFMVLDATRPGPFLLAGQAGGLAWTEPEANMLIAFSAAPGTLAPDAAEGYGPYAKAFAEMIREGDLIPEKLFERVRLRVHDLTKGAQIPWNASKIEAPFRFFERSSGAPARTDAPARTAQLRLQSMRALGPQQGYVVALMRDTFDAYTDFVADYWQDPLARRVRALLAARRESITWRRSCQANEAVAYWTYLERYPHGPHVADAGRRLAKLGAATTPPSKFARVDYDVPPPLPDELEYVERPALMLDDRAFGFEPAPPTPPHFLEPPSDEILNLKPPAAASAAHLLPAPVPLPLPAFLAIPAGAIASLDLSGARGPLGMRPAVDLPVVPERQAPISSIVSPRASASVSNPPSGAQPTPSVRADTTRLKDPDPSALNQGLPDKPTSSLTATAPAATARSSDGLAAQMSVTTVPPLTIIAAPTPGPATAVVVGSLSKPDSNISAPSYSQGLHQETTDQNRPPLTSPRRSATPGWLADTTTAHRMTTSLIFEWPHTIDGEVPRSAPSMFAAASAGLTFQTWHYGLPAVRKTRRVLVQTGASAAATPSQNGTPAQMPRAANPSPQPTAGVPRSTPRSAALSPTGLIGGPQKPNINAAAPSSLAGDQVKQHRKPAIKPVTPSPALDTSNEASPKPLAIPQ
jgi:uncharacterized caspase-like protein